MPTSRERIMVTVTDELGQALDRAALLWPELSRSALLTRLALNGPIRRISPEAAERRRNALKEWRGFDFYDAEFLKQAHDDWRA